MLSFLRDNNRIVTSHLSSNTLMASIVMGISVFSYGFETGVLDTVQAMKCESVPSASVRCPVRAGALLTRG